MTRLFIFPDLAVLPGVFLSQADQARLAELPAPAPICLQEVVKTSTIYPDGRVEEGPTFYGPYLILV